MVRDSFSLGVRAALRAAQVFSIAPGTQTRFRWASPGVLYSTMTTAGVAVRLARELCYKAETSDAKEVVGRFGNVAAHLMAIAISLLFVRLGRRWQRFATLLRKMEALQLNTAAQAAHLHLDTKLRAIMMVVFSMAIIEHSCDKISSTFALWSEKHYSSFLAMFTDIFHGTALQVLSAVTSEVIGSYMAFFYIFNDLFVILVSVTISHHLHALNDSLEFTARQPSLMETEMFWARMRIKYNTLVKLVRQVDNEVNPNVLVTFAQNLFFICFQLWYFIRDAEEPFGRHLFRIGSFLYTAVRMTAVAMSAASVNDSGKASKMLLYSVPSQLYCNEVFRFTQQVAADEVALTGCHFFRVTRSFVLTVAGTITTYEIILLQFNKK